MNCYANYTHHELILQAVIYPSIRKPCGTAWKSSPGSASNPRAILPSIWGKEGLVYLGTGTLTLHDISKDGSVLFSRDDRRSGIAGAGPGDSKERDLSWHDWTVARDISDDGKIVSFDETGEAGEDTGAFYVRGADGSPAVRLGEGLSPSLSRDGKRVLAMVPGPNGRRNLVEIPTGEESPAVFLREMCRFTGRLFSRMVDGFSNSAARREATVFASGSRTSIKATKAISPEGVDTRMSGTISPDGKRMVALDPQGKLVIYTIDGGVAEAISDVQDGDRALRWTADGKTLLVAAVDRPNLVFLLDNRAA